MPKKSLKYTACHEAGHAVLAIKNGFEIHRIRLCRDPNLDSWSGTVDYTPKSWDCPECSGKLKSATCGDDFATLNRDCEHCRAMILSFTTRCLAGGVATKLLEPDEHSCEDSGFDRIEAFKCSASDPTSREKNYGHWLKMTGDCVRRFSKEIQALKESLIEMSAGRDCIEMNGKTACSIIASARIHDKSEERIE
jgi:hypothetical protein